MEYKDTDSVPSMKAILNSAYGKAATEMKNKNYIVIHKNGNPLIIFKKFIVSVEKCEDGTAIIQTECMGYCADEGYATVITQLI